MPRSATRRVFAGLALAVALEACSGGPTPPPTSAPTLTPASTTAPTTPPPTSPALTAPPSPTPAASLGPLSGMAISTVPFSRVSGTPLEMTAPDDGTGRLFVGTQQGQIWVIHGDGTVAKDPMVDLKARIVSGGEQGLLGIAVHPAFPLDPRLFVDFTNKDGDTVIGSLTVDPANADRLDPASFKQLLFIDQPYPNHNGGSIQFGPDGYLTIAMGDGGAGGDPHGNGQDDDALLGKILRIDVDGKTGDKPYGIPPENPFAKSGGAPEIWLKGMRNPWRTSFDRTTGDFWIGDVGQGRWEEVDVVRASTDGLVNFGWNTTEGPDCYNAATCNRDGLTAPVAAFDHDLGCAIVGGYVYRGSAYPFLVGTYVFSDNCSSRVFVIDASSDGPTVPQQVAQVDGNVASFGEDANGELYVLTLQGFVMKLAAAQR